MKSDMKICIGNYPNASFYSPEFGLEEVGNVSKWFDLEEELFYSETMDNILEWLNTRRIEEPRIVDREGIPSYIDSLGELENFLETIVEIDEDARGAYVAMCNNWGQWVSVDDFQEAFCGYFDSEKDYAEELIAQCYDLEEMMGSLASYFDYEAFARDLFISDYWYDEKTEAVFRNI